MFLRNIKNSFKEFITLLLFVIASASFAFNILNAVEVNDNQAISDNSETKEMIQKVPNTQKGLKVYIDPDTGELISQPENGEQIVQPNNSVFGESDEIIQQPEEIIHPDGSATVIMPENFQHSTKITIDENGKQVTECKREHEHAHE